MARNDISHGQADSFVTALEEADPPLTPLMAQEVIQNAGLSGKVNKMIQQHAFVSKKEAAEIMGSGFIDPAEVFEFFRQQPMHPTPDPTIHFRRKTLERCKNTHVLFYLPLRIGGQFLSIHTLAAYMPESETLSGVNWSEPYAHANATGGWYLIRNRDFQLGRGCSYKTQEDLLDNRSGISRAPAVVYFFLILLTRYLREKAVFYHSTVLAKNPAVLGGGRLFHIGITEVGNGIHLLPVADDEAHAWNVIADCIHAGT